MPRYMDIHRNVQADAQAVADDHMKDLQTQGKYGVNYVNYWFDEEEKVVFCLVDAPDKETASKVHREAHGLVADEIHEVKEGG